MSSGSEPLKQFTDSVFGELTWDVARNSWRGRYEFDGRAVPVSLIAVNPVPTREQQLWLIESSRVVFDQLLQNEPGLREIATSRFGDGFCQESEEAAAPDGDSPSGPHRGLELVAVTLGHESHVIYETTEEVFPRGGIIVHLDADHSVRCGTPYVYRSRNAQGRAEGPEPRLTFSDSRACKAACIRRMKARQPFFQGYGTPSIPVWASVPRERARDYSAYYDEELGLGAWFAGVVAALFEWMPSEAAEAWPLCLFEAIPVGVDSDRIRAAVLSSALVDPRVGVLPWCGANRRIREILAGAAECWDRVASRRATAAEVAPQVKELAASADDEDDRLKQQRSDMAFRQHAAMMAVGWAAVDADGSPLWAILNSVSASAGRLGHLMRWYVRMTRGEEALCGAWYTIAGSYGWALRSEHEAAFQRWSERLVEIVRRAE